MTPAAMLVQRQTEVEMSSNLSVPEMGCEVVRPLSQLEGYDLMHLAVVSCSWVVFLALASKRVLSRALVAADVRYFRCRCATSAIR